MLLDEAHILDVKKKKHICRAREQKISRVSVPGFYGR